MEYLLKSMLCLMALLLIHRLLLQREVLHRFNRFFLLAAVVGSFLIPLYTMEVSVEEEVVAMVERQEAAQHRAEVDADYYQTEAEQKLQSFEASSLDIAVPAEIPQKPFPWENVLWATYMSISAIFLFRFLKNLGQLNAKIRKNPHVWYRDETLVLLPEVSSPFSFLKYIFVSKPGFERDGISDAVFAHEQCHVREKHSWDILLIEALMIPLWFHPGLYFARQAIRLNHEFIADQVALKSTQLQDYQRQLLQYINARPTQTMASSLNFSLTKKRLAMMKKDAKNPFKWMKILVLVPLIAGIVYLFSDKVSVQSEEEILAETPAPFIETPVDELEIDIRLLTEMEVEVDGKVIYVEQLNELFQEFKPENALVRLSVNPRLKMAAAADLQEILVENELRRVVLEEWPKYVQSPNMEEERAEYYGNAYILVENENMEYAHKTYSGLSESQKVNLTILRKPTFEKRAAPHPMMFEAWENKEKYNLWLDEKVIPNEELAKLQASEIVMFWTSRVMENARSARFPQPFQVHLYTEEYYEKEIGHNSGRQNPLTNQDTITLTSRLVTWGKDISKYPDPTTAYLQKNARYENLRTSGTIYLHKSQQEKTELDRLYQELNDEYSKTPDNRKKRLKEPIQPSSDTQRNGDPAQSASEIIAVRTASTIGGNETVYRFASSGNLQSKALKEYLQHYGAYQTKAHQSSFGAQKSTEELDALLVEYQEFSDLYAALSFPERRMVMRPTFPYARIEKDGEVTFKHFDKMTTEERKNLGC